MAEKHYLKVWTHFYEELLTGSKTFEVRCFSDQELPKVDDTLVLLEFDEKLQKYTERYLQFVITYILKIAETDDHLCLPFAKTGKPVYCLGIRRVLF